MIDKNIISKEEFTGITFDEIKAHLLVSASDNNRDLLIKSQLESAVELIENYCSVYLREVEVDVFFDEYDVFDNEVTIPFAPILTIENVYIVDKYGVETESTNYTNKGLKQKDIFIPGYIEGYSVKVRCIAGYGVEKTVNTVELTTEDVPAIAIQSIKEILAFWDVNRGDETNVMSGEVRKKLNQISYTPWV